MICNESAITTESAVSTDTFALGRGRFRKPSSTSPDRSTVCTFGACRFFICTAMCRPRTFTFTGSPRQRRFTASGAARPVTLAVVCNRSSPSERMSMVYSGWLRPMVCRASSNGASRKVCATALLNESSDSVSRKKNIFCFFISSSVVYSIGTPHAAGRSGA